MVAHLGKAVWEGLVLRLVAGLVGAAASHLSQLPGPLLTCAEAQELRNQLPLTDQIRSSRPNTIIRLDRASSLLCKQYTDIKQFLSVIFLIFPTLYQRRHSEPSLGPN